MGKHEEQFEQIAQLVCHKPVGVAAAGCHAMFGRRNLLCRAHECCRIHEKTKEQLDYVVFPRSQHAFLTACPGSGKTEVVGLKAAYEIRTWDRAPGGIAVLTFTNNAADIIRQRVSQFVGTDTIGYPHYVGTIDSWLHRYLANPFGHLITRYKGDDRSDCSIRLVESTSYSGFLHHDHFKTKYKYRKVGNWRANQYHWELGPKAWVSSRSGRVVSVEDWAGKDLHDTKSRFLERGFATYEDVYWICHRLLCPRAGVAGKFAQRFPLVIVDECQDLSESQLAILERLLAAGSVLHFVGDLNQAIYAFKKAVPDTVKAFTNKHKFATLPLADNFRSCQPIVDLCGKLVDAGPMRGRPHGGELPACICHTYQRGEESGLVRWFVNLLEARGLSLERSAVVARGYSTVSALRPGLHKRDLDSIEKAALSVHLWNSRRGDARDEAIECIGGFMADLLVSGPHRGRDHYYCPDSVSSPLRWRLALARTLDACSQDQAISDLLQTWSEWARVLNSRFLPVARPHCECIARDARLGVRSPNGKSKERVIDALCTAAESGTADVRITTIHKVKGETLDAVLLVSSPSKVGRQGGHWQEWLDRNQDDGEHARFAFVASSRPRHLLAWAIPSPSPDDINKVEELGFTMMGAPNETGDDPPT